MNATQQAERIVVDLRHRQIRAAYTAGLRVGEDNERRRIDSYRQAWTFQGFCWGTVAATVVGMLVMAVGR